MPEVAETQRRFENCPLSFKKLNTRTAVYIERGMGLILPGLTPDVLGESYVCYPALT